MNDAEKLIAQFKAERAKIVESAEDKYLAACMEQADADALNREIILSNITKGRMQ